MFSVQSRPRTWALLLLVDSPNQHAWSNSSWCVEIAHTVQSGDTVELDLGVEKGLQSRGDVVGVVVAVFVVTMSAVIVVVVAGHFGGVIVLAGSTVSGDNASGVMLPGC